MTALVSRHSRGSNKPRNGEQGSISEAGHPRPLASPASQSTRNRPFRLCVGCRERTTVAELIRVVLDDQGHLVCDENRQMSGRGAWLHPNKKCFDLAERRGAFPRALKVQGHVEASEVLRWILHHAS